MLLIGVPLIVSGWQFWFRVSNRRHASSAVVGYGVSNDCDLIPVGDWYRTLYPVRCSAIYAFFLIWVCVSVLLLFR